jgi:uncharacterized protein YndB with AHSA1/START domain
LTNVIVAEKSKHLQASVTAGGQEMKWILIIGVTMAIIVAGAALIGARLPLRHSATRRAQFTAPVESVWRAITDVEAFPSWRSDVKSVTLLPDDKGRKRWVEDTRSGRIPLVVERSDPPRQLVVRIDDPELPFGGTWTYDVAAIPGGSTLTITEDGEIYNVLFRFMARFVFGYEATMLAYLDALEKRLDSGAARSKV